MLKEGPFIFGSFKKDFSIFHVSTYFTLIYFFVLRNHLSETGWHQEWIAFIILVLIDNGHVYTTVWRTYLNKIELRTHSYYWVFPLICFVAVFFTSQFALSWLWSIVIYWTLYHNFKQIFGFYRWYGYLANYRSKTLDLFFYFICLGPVAIFHFGPRKPEVFLYMTGDIFNFDNEMLYKAFLGLYFVVSFSFLMFVIRQMFLRRCIPATILFFMVTSFVLYGQAFLFVKTSFDIVGPLSLSHGVAYIGIIIESVRRVRDRTGRVPTIFQSVMKGRILGIVGLVFLTAVLFGCADEYLQDVFVSSVNNLSEIWRSVILGLWITPLFCHFYLDSKIWRRDHSDFRIII